ncbi:hypothetical protein AYJ08_05860 [Brevibacillus sp. SKDU10]|uniref:hypothetical protein n=1 Tax=Brevibacillus sp. SKDU10 TaxID=1247872 RepID=UPI0007C8E2FE|nr:hypothetical protein [Brevibacillus sp. SKDU10]OAJ75142.1 hypothetical protein AYJ08_05860 [Brevibacillus sp. SKDU10]
MILTVHERHALAMKHAKKFVGRSAARPILSGVYHSADGTLVATDAHRLLRVENAHERSEAIVLDSKTSAPIDGTYPDISHIIPKVYCAEYAFGSESLEELIKAHEIMVKVGGKKSPYASIAVTGSGLTFTTTCGIGVYEVSPTVQIESFSDEFTLHYNAQFVLDALIALRDFKPKTVGIKFTGEESPFVIDTDDGVLALILPIRRQKEVE